MIEVVDADGFSVEVNDDVGEMVAEIVDVRAKTAREDQKQIDQAVHGNVGDDQMPAGDAPDALVDVGDGGGESQAAERAGDGLGHESGCFEMHRITVVGTKGITP